MSPRDESEAEADLSELAASDDTHALEQLLLMHHDRLSASISRRLPARVRAMVSADDIVQETCIRAFRRISTFQPQGPGSFYRWLLTIARNQLRDAQKRHGAAKRGGGANKAHTPDYADSMVQLLEMVAVDEHTPSRSVARREGVGAAQIALAGLKDDYRRAIEMRYIQGLTVAQTAAKLDRTERAVHMLCHRGLKRLKAAMGRSADFLSHKG